MSPVNQDTDAFIHSTSNGSKESLVKDSSKHAYNFNNPTMNQIWDDLGEGFYSYGRISPLEDVDHIKDLRRGNMDMIKWMIKKLNITADSVVLDLCCGPGAYIVNIAKMTGCSFVGTDINENYLDRARALAAREGVERKGEFYYGAWGAFSEEVKKGHYTHIISVEAMYYGHDILDSILSDIADCCQPDTTVFIADFVRKARDWEDCAVINSHLKLRHEMKSVEQILTSVNSSRLFLVDFEDMTQYIIPGYLIMTRECHKRDPHERVLTFPRVGRGFIEGKLGQVIFYFKLKP